VADQQHARKPLIYNDFFWQEFLPENQPSTPSLWTNTMNRCLQMPLLRLLTMLAVVFLWTSIHSPAAAQTTPRQFPPAAKRGTMVVTAPPQVLINGAVAQLSPGARIRGVTNMMVMSASLVGTSVLVNYVRDPLGLVHEVWILSEQEAQEKRDGMEPLRNFRFGSDADKTKTDN